MLHKFQFASRFSFFAIARTRSVLASYSSGITDQRVIATISALRP